MFFHLPSHFGSGSLQTFPHSLTGAVTLPRTKPSLIVGSRCMLLRNQKQLSDTFQSRSSSPDPSYSSTLTCASYTMLSSTTSSQEDQKEDLPLQQNSATECASMADTIGSLVQNQLRLFLNKQETTINNQLAHVETALHEQQKQIDRLTASFQSSIPSILSMDKAI